MRILFYIQSSLSYSLCPGCYWLPHEMHEMRPYKAEIALNKYDRFNIFAIVGNDQVGLKKHWMHMTLIVNLVYDTIPVFLIGLADWVLVWRPSQLYCGHVPQSPRNCRRGLYIGVYSWFTTDFQFIGKVEATNYFRFFSFILLRKPDRDILFLSSYFLVLTSYFLVLTS